MEPPAYLEGQGQAFLGPYKAETPRSYVHGAGDRFDGKYDLIRAVRDKRFKYLRNHMPERGFYLPVAYREQMPLMQELLRMRDEGTLNEIQMQWFRPAKPLEELFDTVNDPHEINNLAADPAYVAKLAELRQEHDRWIAAIDDNGMVPEHEHIARVWPNGIQPVTATPRAIRQGTEIMLRTPTLGASIGYQVVKRGEEPGDHWMVYTRPVTLQRGEELVAIADHIGFVPSEVVRIK